MVSHITYDGIDPFYPASFSSIGINSLLRGEMGFDGIVVTDDLEMQGTRISSGNIIKAFVLAFRAGNDLILVSHTKATQQELMDGIVALFHENVLSEADLDEKVLRILKAKRRYLLRFYLAHGGSIVQDRLLEQSIEENIALSRKGIVLMSSRIDEPTTAFFRQAKKEEKRGLILSPSKSFSIRAKRHLPLWDVIDIEYYPDKYENRVKINSVRDKLEEYDIALLGFANERHIPWAWACETAGLPFAVLSYNNPQYAIRFAPHALFIVTCFAPYNPATDALFSAVFETGEFCSNFPYEF
jgi:beta-N-acetylhexosaminidase